MLFAIWPWVPQVFNIVMLLLAIFLILLVLIQRGKGGGLAGAFGGVGGSSPFGSRAGDLFTRVTLVVAGAWLLLLMIQVKVVQADLAQHKQDKELTIEGPGKGLRP